MKIYKILISAIITILYIGSIQAQIQDDPILKSIKSEVDRNKAGLHAGTLAPPFWISFSFLETDRMIISATQGDIIAKLYLPMNMGSSNILVGDTKLNNNNGQGNNYNTAIGKTDLESAIKYAIWNQLDPSYKSAAESFERKKVQITQQNISEEDRNINDWDQSIPTQYYDKKETPKIDMDFWGDYCRKASLAISRDTAIQKSGFLATLIQGNYYYYSTDGFMYRLPMCCIEITGSVECRTKDGQVITENYRYYFDNTNDVTPIEDLCAQITKFNTLLIEESNAPLISDSYSGPVLFEGAAVSTVIKDQFINKNNGLLAKRKPMAQTGSSNFMMSSFTMFDGESNGSENRMEQMMNKKVADRRLDFISMTGTPQWKGQKLFGYTPIDAQGVKPDSSLVLIEKGILKNLLSDRTPTKTNPISNGHNLFSTSSPNSGLGAGVLRVRSSKTIPGKELKDSLLAAAKDEGYDFAYIRRSYDHLSGSFLYKVYSDGREEMVRNWTINDLNQKQFKYILEIGAEECLYNFKINDSKCSIIAPCGIIFKELEIVRNNNNKLNKPYLVSRPVKKK